MEKVLGLERLPIFPLPLVLMPGEIIPLHIFEPRYRQMIEDLPATRNIFGINFYDPSEDFDRPTAGSVGCSAEVSNIQPLEDGRSNMIVQGVVRYRIVEYFDGMTPYNFASVEYFEDSSNDKNLVEDAANEVFDLFRRVADAAFKMSGNRGQLPEIPRAEPEMLSYLVAAAFNLENELKYNLIKMTSTLERLERIRGILQRSVEQIEDGAELHRVAQTNGHSKKKLDL